MNICPVLSSSSNSLPLSVASATGTLSSCEINGGGFFTLLAGCQARRWVIKGAFQSTQSPHAGLHGSEHRGSSSVHEWLSWEESQSLGHRVETTGPRKAQHPMPAACRRANLWRGQVFSGKKRRGSSGRAVTDTPLLFQSSLRFRGAVALTCLCQEPTAGLDMGHCSPLWSTCLQCIFLAY